MKRFYIYIPALIFLCALNEEVFAQSTTYATAGGSYTVTVPTGVTQMSFDVAGAAGGSIEGGTGGSGGRVQGILSVTPGEVLYIFVGGTGGSYPAYAGGVSAGGETGGIGGDDIGGGGGGGGSDIRTSVTGGATSTGSLDTRVVTGGGGGGGGWYTCTPVNGGNGGDPGVAGGVCSGTAGGGATTAAAGAAGTGGTAGTLGAGGACTGAAQEGGGGGGGYYGGGGSARNGGGGGSSDAGTGTSGVTYTTGYESGTGYVTICFYPGVASVSASPNPICLGNSLSLSGTSTNSTGYTWTGPTGGAAMTSTTSLNTEVLSVNASNAGVYTLTATNACGTSVFTTASVSINAEPAAISGNAGVICPGNILNLSDATGAGTWVSSNVATATVGSSSGVATGVAGGTSTVTFTLTSSGCTITTTVTTDPVAAISGITTLCGSGGITSLSDTYTGGAWSSGNTSVATASTGASTTVVSGGATGTAVISYTLTGLMSGCSATDIVTVTPAPGAIGGTFLVCTGSTVTLTDLVPGGSWSSGNISVATVDGSGDVTGVAVGTAVITYTGCGGYVTQTVTVNQTPGIPTAIVNGTITSNSIAISWTASTGSPISYTVLVYTNSGLTIPATGYTVSYAGTTATINALSASTEYWYTVVANTAYCTSPAAASQTGTTACNGTPDGGVSSISPISGGATTVFTLSLTGYSPGAGISFQWQSSPDGSTWTNIAGATNTTYSFTGISSTTYYQCIVTCSGSGLSTASTVTQAVTEACTTTTSSWINGWGTGSNTFTYSTAAAQVYTVIPGVTSIIADVQGAKGGGVNDYDDYQSIGGYGGRVLISGSGINVTGGHVLSVLVGKSGATTGAGGWPGGGTDGAFSAVWPGAGGGGYSGLRDSTTSTILTIAGGGGGGGGDCAGCDIGGQGGNLIGGNSDGGDGGNTTTMTGGAGGNAGTFLTGGSVPGGDLGSGGGGGGYEGGGGGGSADGGGGGGGSSYVNATYVVGTYTMTQGYNSTATGGTVIIGYTPPSLLTCGINAFSVTAATGPNLSDAGMVAAASPTTGYLNRIALSPITLYIGGAYASSIVWETDADYQEAQVWIDFNNNGTFEASEQVTGVLGYSTSLTPNPTTFNISIPGTANPGEHLMRVRGIIESVTGTLGLSSALDPCLNQYLSTGPLYNGGDEADYTVNIQCNMPAINGVTNICSGGSTTLTDAMGSGNWTTTAGSGAVSVTSGGVVTGTATGTANISYTLGYCYSSTTVTVTAPVAITGTGFVCVGLTTTLTNAISGGTWSSSNTAVGTVATTTGVVTGESAGTTNITYTTGAGCTSTTVVTVTGDPGGITGTFVVCQGSAVVLSNSLTGGTWSSSNTAIATAGAGTGIVTGQSGGTVTITYSMGIGCFATTVVTVNPFPGSISGNLNVCTTTTTTLSDAITVGTWSASNSNATVGSGSGVVSGSAAGTDVITYSTGPACYVTTIVTVYTTPGIIFGGTTVCQGSTTGLLDFTAGGTWTSSNTSIATVSPSTGTSTTVSGISGGVVTITYSTGGSCYVTQPVTVTGIPSLISGNPIVCSGFSINLTDSASGGAWSTSSGAVATIGTTAALSPGSTAQVIGGSTLGTVTVTYNTGCAPAATVVLTVTAAPAAITGTAMTVCAGSTITLSDTSPAGTWSSSSPGIGSVGSATGVVTGVSSGTTTIFFTTICGSVSQIVTVNASPAAGAITGPGAVCTGSTIPLSDATASGGTGAWSSSNTSVATVGGATGIVDGVSPGTVTITYTETSPFCGSNYTTTTVTVNSSPIAGTIGSAGDVCVGSNLQLSDATASGGTGTWSSSIPTNGSVGSTSGIVTGINAGTTTITYTETSTFCGSQTTTTVVTINVSPIAGTISGPGSVCTGLTIPLSDATASGGTGAWSSSNTSVATVGGATGVVDGVSPGTATITYTEISASCGSIFTTTIVTVNISPSAGTIGGPGFVCVGSTVQLSDATASGGTGTWSSSSTGIGGVGSSSGIVTGISVGTTTIIYTETSAFCGSATTTTIMTVDVSPFAGTITGPGSVCTGLTIPLSDATASGGTGAWSSSNTSVATVGGATGIVDGVSPGTATITYTEISASCGSIFTTTIVTVNISPSAGTIGSPGFVCVGTTIQLSDATASGGTGTWSSSSTGIGGVGSSSGIVTGISIGTTTIIYTETSAFCGSATTSTVVTVDVSPSAGTINGLSAVCAGLTIPLTDVTSSGGTGSWSSSNTTIGTVGATTGIVYGVSGGVITITYTEASASCGSTFTTITVTVNANPAPIAGIANVCVGLTTSLSSATAGGTWASEHVAVGTVGLGTGIVYGVSSGTSTIVYELSTGCLDSATVTVNPNPAPITGITSVCAGLTTSLSSATASGTWLSSNGNASIGGGTGLVTGEVAGTSTITYELGTGCMDSTTVTVNPNPTTITGTLAVCVGLTTTLNSTPAGGTWISTSGLISVNASSGAVTGLSAGTANDTYLLPTGCIVTAVVTVDPLPSAIGGTLSVCVGSTTTLTDAGGGTWSLSNANAGNAGSLIFGSSAGLDIVTYTLPTGCIATAVVTVNPLPATITGSMNVCSGLVTILSDATTGGTWISSASGTGSIGSASGIITGGTSGTVTITYMLTATGCQVTAIVTVNPVPSAISGILSVCVGLTTSLSDGSGGGTWSSSNTNATIGTSGMVTGAYGGTSTITYAFPTGCIATTAITVNSLPGTILGDLAVCSGLTTSLSDATGGGTWSSGSTTIATVGSTSGIVTGGTVLTTSTATITYTIGTGCIMTAIVTVNPLPTAILGVDSVCSGLTTSLSDATGPGTWSSSAPVIASVGVTTGIVTGGAVSTASTATITYALTATGCITTTVVTVNPLPTAILGIDSVCSGSQVTLSDASGTGTWSSSATSIATVGLTSGIVTGETVVTSSTSTITFTLITGCTTTTVITVNPLPSAITGTLDVCPGLTTTLADASTPGTWSIGGGTGIASIGAGSGVVTGVSAGTSEIIYVLPTGCQTTAVVTINPLPGAILGTLSVCQGLQTSLSDGSASGTWSSSNTSVATVSGSGLVSGTASGTVALTATITYTLPTGCISTAVVTVNPLPATITGTLDVCSGLTTILSDITPGGTWSSSASGTASVTLLTGVVTGGTAGTATITYMLTTGCIETTVVTTNPLPTSILGTLRVCSGLTTDLSDVTPGGAWSSSAPGIASVGLTTGIVTGETVGVTSEAIITYTIPTGCITIAIVTVNPLPGTIEGTLDVCLGLTTNLTDAAAGGVWSSSNTHAIIGSATGTVTGNSAGASMITYTLSTGCIMTAIATVNPLPAVITGTLNLCVGTTAYLSDASSGGTWSSSNTSSGSVGSVSGEVAGVSPGTATITYTLPTGCISTVIITVNPQPDSIKGFASVCYESETSLSDAPAGGVWSSSNTLIASIGSTGLVYGAGVGYATVSYSLADGCTAIDLVTINALPQVFSITPTSGSYCEGGSGVSLGLNGSSVGVSYELFYYLSITGYDSSVTGYIAGTGDSLTFGHEYIAGTYTVLATNSTTGCKADMYGSALITIIPTVNPMISILSLSGDTVCPGTSVTFVPDTVHAGASPTYKWYVNGVLVSLDADYTYIPANGDLVSVTLNSDGVCVVPPTATGSLKMTVLPDAVPQISISIYPGDTACQYALATFTATPTFGGPTPQYIWYVNGAQQTITGSEFSYYPATGDIVYCKMVSDYQCRSADTGYSNAAVMTVAPMIVPNVEVRATPGFIITAGQQDSLWTVVSNAGPAPTYQWEVNGVPVQGATNAFYVSQFNNYDSVTCVVTSSGYCDGISAFDWAFITVYPLGIQQVAAGKSDIALLPNPNQGSFTIRGTLGTVTDEEVTIEVTDMIGQVIYSSKVAVSGGKINEQIKLSNTLANGMYLLNLRSGSDNEVFHFVIEQ